MFQTHRVDACILLDFASSAFDVYSTKHTLYKMVVNRKSIKVIGLETFVSICSTTRLTILFRLHMPEMKT